MGVTARASVNSKVGDVVLNAGGIGATANHNHNGVYQPVGDYLTSYLDRSDCSGALVLPAPTSATGILLSAGATTPVQAMQASNIPTVSYPVTKVNADCALRCSGDGRKAVVHTRRLITLTRYAASNHNPLACTHQRAIAITTRLSISTQRSPARVITRTRAHSQYAPNSAGNGISISSGKIQMSSSYTGVHRVWRRCCLLRRGAEELLRHSTWLISCAASSSSGRGGLR